MNEQSAGLHGTLKELLRARQLERPDGRPLHAYRFTRSEYDRIRDLLRRNRSIWRPFPTGTALFVAYVAEWFRRDRQGGHWDWIRPLEDIGLRYSNSGRSDIKYQEILDAIQTGLRA